MPAGSDLPRGRGPGELAPALLLVPPPPRRRRRRDPQAPVSDPVRPALLEPMRILLEREGELGPGGDDEAVHQARVAIRRLRSRLAAFGDLIEPGWSSSLDEGLRTVARDLGAVRDADVLCATLAGHATFLDPAERRLAEHLTAPVRRRRDRSRRELAAWSRSPLRARLRAALRAALSGEAGSVPLTRYAAFLPAGPTLRAISAQRYRSLVRAARGAGTVPTDRALHRVRVRAKQCRYVAEVAAPVHGGRARRLVRACTAIQECLGAQHDAVVALAYLRSLLPELDEQSAFVAGLLGARCADADLAARAEWSARVDATRPSRPARW